MVVRRGFKRAASYHTEKLIKAPVGHFFDVISNGFGAMPSYASRVAPDDRWRIIAYIRALQYSMTRTTKDVPAGEHMEQLPITTQPANPPAAAPPPQGGAQ